MHACRADNTRVVVGPMAVPGPHGLVVVVLPARRRGAEGGRSSRAAGRPAGQGIGRAHIVGVASHADTQPRGHSTIPVNNGGGAVGIRCTCPTLSGCEPAAQQQLVLCLLGGGRRLARLLVR